MEMRNLDVDWFSGALGGNQCEVCGKGYSKFMIYIGPKGVFGSLGITICEDCLLELTNKAMRQLKEHGEKDHYVEATLGSKTYCMVPVEES